MPRLGLTLEDMPHEEMVKLAREVQEEGVESLWLAEGLGNDVFVQSAALASKVPHIKFASSVSNIFSRSAIQMTMAAATVDEISAGRFTIGIGAGHQMMIEKWHGFAFDKPLQRMRDYITIIRRSLNGEEFTYEGETHTVRDLKLHYPVKTRRIPIYLGAVGFAMCRLAGEVADGVILHLNSLQRIAEVRAAVAQGAKRSGRKPSDIDIVSFIICSPSPDQVQARREVIDALAFYGYMVFYRKLYADQGFVEEAKALEEAWARNDHAAAARAISERMLNSLPVAAGPEQTRKRIEELRTAGVDLPVIYEAARHSPGARFRSVPALVKAAQGR